jgi:hypothetical protein
MRMIDGRWVPSTEDLFDGGKVVRNHSRYLREKSFLCNTCQPPGLDTEGLSVVSAQQQCTTLYLCVSSWEKEM